jgi:hypothetical protein
MSQVPTGEDGRELTAHSRDARGHLLRPKERPSREATAQGLSALGDRLVLVREMVLEWDLRAARCRVARAAAEPPGQEPASGRRGIADSRSSEKTTGVGGEQRGYDGNKKLRGRKRHLLVDTEGFILRAEVHSVKVMDRYGIQTLLRQADTPFARPKHPWVGAGLGGEDGGKDWAEKKLGWSVELV